MPFKCPGNLVDWLLATAIAGITTATCMAQSSGGLTLDPQVAAGTWLRTGGLHEARVGHTATLLPNGNVLVVGGWGNSILDTAEVYGAATGTWNAAGRLSLPRSGHTATVLTDGRVLVADGDTTRAPPNFGRTGTAELYDPATGTFAPTGVLAAPRSGHTATLLQDGRVLVAGGFDNDNVGGVELYDPATGTWSSAASLAIARYWHTATRLEDGRVLIARGSNSGDLECPLSSAEVYEPGAGRWAFVGDSGTSSVFHTATRLADGTVLVTGGYGGGVGGGPVVAASRRFDPATQTWIQVGDLSTPRYGHTATLLPDGSVLVTGGVLTNGHYPNLQYTTLASAERFDPATGTWTTAANLGGGRHGHTATLLDNGYVLIVGGATGNVPSDSAELYVNAASSPPYRITELYSDQAGLYQYVLL